MMTLDEAIKNCEEIAEVCEYEASKYDMSNPYKSRVACQNVMCAEKHRQLAEWLKELKRLKEQEPCEDAVSRSSLLNKLDDCYKEKIKVAPDNMAEGFMQVEKLIKQEPSVTPTQKWIPVSERLPENVRPVIVTWKNNDPKSYYQYIVGKHFTGTACYKNGKWYWYSSKTEDMLAEYGRYDSEEFDEAIECIAWLPLPKPYKESEDKE